MGKRTNTILQSAFFTLAKVLPQEDAIRYMKEKAYRLLHEEGRRCGRNEPQGHRCRRYRLRQDRRARRLGRRPGRPRGSQPGGQARAGQDGQGESSSRGQDGRRQPAVSAFVDHVDGQFEQGASAYEKRGVAVMVPTWDETKCIQCNNCAYVCPHATIRPFALTEEEAKNAPATAKNRACQGRQGQGRLLLHHGRLPAGLHGLRRLHRRLPTKALTMVGQEQELPQQEVFDYCVAKVAEKPELQDNTVKGSQFHTPLLEFSGSCAGCAETSYARLVTQLFGDRMYISNATAAPPSGKRVPAATSPYCTNKEGRGPAWSNSLFEDNAEHGLGMFLGQEAIRNRLVDKTNALLAVDWTDADLKAAAQTWLDTMNDGKANAEATRSMSPLWRTPLSPAASATPASWAVRSWPTRSISPRSPSGSSAATAWAYDIGFGGLDHVLASGKNVNVFVFDTEVYSNTGGQASKASNIGQVAQFAAAGKEMKKKSLSEIAMSYGYVYVAQIAMGANPAQTLKAITEAEAYDGPSLIIGYAPCEMHSIKGGMTNCQAEMKKAVECGYWNLFRFNPAAEGDKFILDSKEPAGGYQEFLMNEARYSRLTPRVPRACYRPLRPQRGGRQGALRAPAQAQGHVRQAVIHRYSRPRRSRGGVFHALTYPPAGLS